MMKHDTNRKKRSSAITKATNETVLVHSTSTEAVQNKEIISSEL